METPIAVLPEHRKPLLPLFAWAVMLSVSDLPDILWHSLAGSVPPWLTWSKLALLALSLGLCLSWRAVRPLWHYTLVFLVFQLALRASFVVQGSSGWQGLFGGKQASFGLAYLGSFIPDLGVAGAVLAVLWLLKRRRADFFLTQGKLDAPIQPVRWLGIRQGESWRVFGWIFTIAASLAVAIPTALSIHFTPEVLARAALLLPAVLAFAAINAFVEEVYFRASLLSTLPEVIGRGQALLISMVFFGLAHWLYGSPPGLVGFLMTGFLAFLLGKSMIETRGLGWPWFIHFGPDVVIFASYAILWVQR